MQKISETRRKIDEFCGTYGKYAPDAYEFVTKCVIAQVNSLDAVRHLSAREVIRYIADQLDDRFGILAGNVLEEWKIKTASDIGEIVFDLISLQILSASADDRRADFDIDFPLVSCHRERTTFVRLEIPQID